jgi:hypothetical protein
MNLRQLLILLALAIVLGGAGLVLYRNQNAARTSGHAVLGRKLLGDLPVNDVARIVIRQETNTLELVRRDDLWRVTQRHDYPADFSRISGFLLKARELKAVQSEPVGPSQLARFQLAPAGQGTNSAMVVELAGTDDRTIKTLLVGKTHLKTGGRPSPFGDSDMGWPDGRYVKTADSDQVALVSDPLENLEPKPEAWLNKDFFKVEKPGSIEITFPIATNSWKLARNAEAAEWKLADARPEETLDAAKIAGVANPLSSPTFTDVAPGARLPGEGTNAPTVVKLETFDHFSYTVSVGAKTNENYPITVAVTAQIPAERLAGKEEKPEDKTRLDKEFKERQQKLEEKLKRDQGYGKWTYLVPGWSLEPLLKERHQLLVEKPEEPKPEEGAAAEPAEPTIQTNAP